MKCPVCHGTEFGEPLVQDLRPCMGCGLRRREQIPTADELRDRTANFSLRAQTNKMSRKDRFADAEQQMRMIDLKPGRVFDVGAAGGFFLKIARDHGWEIFGNEISKVAIAFARKTYGIYLLYGLLEELMVPANMDAVVLWNTLEHCIDPLATMKICRWMLRPGGVCIISVPCKLDGQAIQSFTGGHLSEFTPESLEMCCRSAGFQLHWHRWEMQGKTRQGISRWLA